MRMVIAPDSFKNSSSAICVAESIEKGIRRVKPDTQIVKVPIADGGEGTVDAILIGSKGQKVTLQVQGPLGKCVEAKYVLIDKETAFIEMAEASGLQLLSNEERNPMETSTYGVGQLILAALDRGASRIVLGIGGSATNDGGIGMAMALGVKFLDKTGHPIPVGGKGLAYIDRIDKSEIDPRIARTEFKVACDVKNPLCGPEGATAIYGPQKGATPKMVQCLEKGMQNYAKAVGHLLEGSSYHEVPGAGAAGGLGMGLMAFCGATLHSGIDTILDMVQIEKYLEEADLVITGEGNMDGQSIYGKVPVGLAKRVEPFNVPVVAIVGGMGIGATKVYDHRIQSIMPLTNRPMVLEEAIKNVDILLQDAAERMMRFIEVGKHLN